MSSSSPSCSSCGDAECDGSPLLVLPCCHRLCRACLDAESQGDDSQQPEQQLLCPFAVEDGLTCGQPFTCARMKEAQQQQQQQVKDHDPVPVQLEEVQRCRDSLQCAVDGLAATIARLSKHNGNASKALSDQRDALLVLRGRCDACLALFVTSSNRAATAPEATVLLGAVKTAIREHEGWLPVVRRWSDGVDELTGRAVQRATRVNGLTVLPFRFLVEDEDGSNDGINVTTVTAVNGMSGIAIDPGHEGTVLLRSSPSAPTSSELVVEVLTTRPADGVLLKRHRLHLNSLTRNKTGGGGGGGRGIDVTGTGAVVVTCANSNRLMLAHHAGTPAAAVVSIAIDYMYDPRCCVAAVEEQVDTTATEDSFVVTFGQAGKVARFRALDGTHVWTSIGEGFRAAAGVAVLPDRGLVAVCDPRRGNVQLLDLRDGNHVSTVPVDVAQHGEPFAVAYDPFREAVVVATTRRVLRMGIAKGAAGSAARLYSADPNDPIVDVAVSPACLGRVSVLTKTRLLALSA